MTDALTHRDMHRIILRRTKGWRMPADTVKVARPTKWGNPFKVGMPDIRDAQTAVIAYADALARQGYVDYLGYRVTARDIVTELHSKHLACFCQDAWCHANRMLDIASGRHPPMILLVAPTRKAGLDECERHGIACAYNRTVIELVDGRVVYICTQTEEAMGLHVDTTIFLPGADQVDRWIANSRAGRASRLINPKEAHDV